MRNLIKSIHWPAAERESAGHASVRRVDVREAALSADVVERFIDVLTVRECAPSRVRRFMQMQLSSLDYWLQEYRRRTLLNARGDDLRDYLAPRASQWPQPSNPLGMRRLLRRFYGHLLEAQWRSDDPSLQLASRCAIVADRFPLVAMRLRALWSGVER